MDAVLGIELDRLGQRLRRFSVRFSRAWMAAARKAKRSSFLSRPPLLGEIERPLSGCRVLLEDRWR